MARIILMARQLTYLSKEVKSKWQDSLPFAISGSSTPSHNINTYGVVVKDKHRLLVHVGMYLVLHLTGLELDHLSAIMRNLHPVQMLPFGEVHSYLTTLV